MTMDLALIYWIWYQKHKQQPKKAVDKLDHVKIKNFCASKDAISRVKRQPVEWEKIFANHLPEKGLISRVCEEPQNSTTTKTNNLIKKWAKDLNRHFSKKMISNHSGNASQNHNEIPPIRTATIKQTNKQNKCLARMWRSWTPVYSWWECKIV